MLHVFFDSVGTANPFVNKQNPFKNNLTTVRISVDTSLEVVFIFCTEMVLLNYLIAYLRYQTVSTTIHKNNECKTVSIIYYKILINFH